MDNSGCICSICGWSSGGSIGDLQAHLNSHSKQDLIRLLIQNQNPLQESSQKSKARIGRTDEDSCSSQMVRSDSKVTQSTLIFSGSNSTSEKVLATLEPVTLKLTTNEGEDTDTDNERGCSSRIVQVCSFSVPLSNETDTEDAVPTPSFGNLNSGNISTASESGATNSGNFNSDTISGWNGEVVLVGGPVSGWSAAEDGPPHPQPCSSSTNINLQTESDNATSQTSIIKYIIDQNERSGCGLERGCETESWILSEGYNIPVYSSTSSFAQLQEARKPGCSIDRPPPSEKSVALNLLTDEEIPPRGEISEYEESNTSSFLSEDSTLRFIGSSDPRRTSPMMLLDKSSKTCKRKPKRDMLKISPQLSGSFSCELCSSLVPFKSMFEIIAHKVKVHNSDGLRGMSLPGLSGNEDPNASSTDDPPSMLPELGPPPPAPPPPAMYSSSSKEFMCLYCEFVSKTKRNLHLHMSSQHKDKPKNPTIFECSTCGKTFPARTNLRKHMVIHRERKHVCGTCSKGFTSNFKLMEHYRVHTKVYPYKCDLCDKQYRTPSLLNHHKKVVHVPPEERPLKPRVEYYCGVCHKVLKSKRSYMNHSQVHKAQPKKCPHCCETFVRQSVLVRHIRITHDPHYVSSECKDCPICGKKFHPNSMIKHMRIHSDEKPYSCQVCQKKFRTYANLTSHSWSHTNLDRPFKCRICPKSYLFKKTLEHHMMVHKRRTLHFVCNECGVRFTNKVNMKRHLEEHFSEKRFKCGSCGKAFQRNYYLLEHQRIHTGLKPFLCNICGKASTTKSNHRAHMKIHDARDSGGQEG